MHDLIYCGDEYEDFVEIRQLLLEEYPDLTLVEDSDYIKGYRISIEGDVDTKEYFRFLIDKNLAVISFRFQMSARMPGPDQECLREIMQAIKAQNIHDQLQKLSADRLRNILSDIWINDERREDINDLDTYDLIVNITEWVDNGIKQGLWTEDSWIMDVLGPDSPY